MDKQLFNEEFHMPKALHWLDYSISYMLMTNKKREGLYIMIGHDQDNQPTLSLLHRDGYILNVYGRHLNI